MAKNFTIARPYARAVFKEASEAHQLQEWLHVLQGLAMIAADPDVSRLLVNPKLLEKQVIDFFYDLIQKLAEQFVQPISEKAHNFLALQSQNRLKKKKAIKNFRSRGCLYVESFFYLKTTGSLPE